MTYPHGKEMIYDICTSSLYSHYSKHFRKIIHFLLFSFFFQNSFFFFTQILLFLVKNIRPFKTFLGAVFLIYLLLLLLSRFSCVWLCVTPQTAAHQAPPSLGFSRQEPWSGLPFPSLMHESEKWKWSLSVMSDS